MATIDTRDIVGFMAKSAPGAVIVMSATDLQNFAREISAQTVVAQPARPRKLRGLTAQSEQGEIIQAIMEVWPETTVSALANTLGVSRKWIMKCLVADVQAEAAKVETLGDVAQILSKDK